MIEKFIGKYSIIQKIGAGAMGTVYKAMDSKLGRPVAIKLMPPQFASDPEHRQRFFREAIAPAKLFHPNIVAIYDLDEVDETPFIVMEYIDGADLSAVLQSGRGLSVQQALNFLRQAAEGLDFAHRHGVIHRDIKPANFLLARTGTVKIVDFGVAKVLEDVQQTRTGMIIGTPAYMSPEQARGDRVDTLSDQFSMGVVAYEILTRVNPFHAENYTGVLLNILQREVPPPSQVEPACPPDLCSAVMKAMSRPPLERYASMSEFSAAVQEIMDRFKFEECRLDGLVAGLFARPEPEEGELTRAIRKQIQSGDVEGAGRELERLRLTGATLDTVLHLESELAEASVRKESEAAMRSVAEHESKGDFDSAMKACEKLLAKSPDHVKALSAKQRLRRILRDRAQKEKFALLMEEASRKKNGGDYDGASVLYRSVLAEAPGDEEAMASLRECEGLSAQLLVAKRLVSEAQAALSKSDLPKAFQLAIQLEVGPVGERLREAKACVRTIWRAFLSEFRSVVLAGVRPGGLALLRNWLSEMFGHDEVMEFVLSSKHATEREEFIRTALDQAAAWVGEFLVDAARGLVDELKVIFPNHEAILTLSLEIESASRKRGGAGAVGKNRLSGTTARLVVPASAAAVPERAAPSPMATTMPFRKNLSREEKIEACLRAIVQRPDFPAISQHIQEVMGILQDEEKSLRTLTNIILKDYSMTLRVLRTANSAWYNRTGRQIMSVSQAVLLLGSEVIRNLTGGMVFLDHFHHKSTGLKELMLMSLLSANHARQAAFSKCFPHPEEAYLCGLFRNLGEVLIACYFPQDYARVLVEMREKKLSDRRACLNVLGIFYEDLGLAMAKHWNVSDKVNLCITQYDPQSHRASSSETDMLQAMVAFSHGLTAAVYRQEQGDVRLAVELLMEKFSRVLPFKKEDVREILDESIQQTMDTFSILKVQMDGLQLRKQSAMAVEVLSGRENEDADFVFPVEQESPWAILQNLTMEVESLISDDGPFNLTATLMMIQEAVNRGCGMSRSLFCLLNPEKTLLSARLGLGEGTDTMIDKFRIPLNRGGVLAVAVLGKRDLFVGDLSEPYFPDPFIAQFEPGGFGLLPVTARGILVGALYFDRPEPFSSTDAEWWEGVSRLRDLAGKALEKRSPC